MKKFLRKTLRYFISPILLLFFVSVSMLFIPKIQNIIVSEISKSINNNINLDMTISDINISPFGYIDLNDVVVRDNNKDTLLYIKKLNGLLYPTSLIFKNLSFSYIDIDGGFIKIDKHKGDLNNNLEILLNNLNKKGDSEEKSNFNFKSSNINLHNFSFYNPKHNMEDIDLDINNIHFENGNFKFDLEKIELKNNNRLKLHGNITYTDNILSLDKIVLSRKNTKAKINVKIKLGDRPTVLDANIDGKFHLKDFEDFMDIKTFEKDDEFDLMINSENKNGKLIFSRIELKYKKLFLVSNGLLDRDKFYFDFNSSDIDFSSVEDLLKKIFPKNNIDFNQYLVHDKSTLISGKIYKYGDTINLYTDFKLDSNDVVSLCAETDVKNPYSFNATINTKNLILSDILKNENLDAINSEINISKNGDDTIEVDYNIYSIEYKKIIYENIRGNFHKKNNNIYIDLSSECENFISDLSLNLNKKKHSYIVGFNLDVKRAIIPLNDDIIMTKFNFKSNLKYDLNGDLYFKSDIPNISIISGNKKYEFNNIETYLRNEKELKSVKIKSKDALTLDLDGKFSYENLNEYFISLFDNYIYSNIDTKKLNDSSIINLDLKINNNLASLFGVKYDGDLSLNFEYNQEKNFFNLNLDEIENISYENYSIKNLFLSIHSDKNNDNISLISSKINTPYINFDTLDIRSFSSLKKDTLFVELNLKNKQNNSDYNLNLSYNLSEDKDIASINFNRSSIKFDSSNVFHINEYNLSQKITYDINKNKFEIGTITVVNNNRKLSLYGDLTDGIGDVFLKLNDININYELNENVFKDFSFNTNLRGNIHFHFSQNGMIPYSDLWLDDLNISGHDYGQVFMKINNENNNIKTYLNITKNNRVIFNANGNIPNEKFSDFYINVEFFDFDIAPLNSITYGILDNVGGNLNGKGRLIMSKDRDMYLVGNYNLENGSIGIPYLGISKKLPMFQNFTMDKDGFILKDIKIYSDDSRQEKEGEISGYITHKNFKLWDLNLDIRANKGKVFDLKSANREGIYGVVYADGICNIKAHIGDEVNFDFNVDAKISNNSIFLIDIDKIKKTQDNIISFKSPLDTGDTILNIKKTEVNKTTSSTKLNFNFKLNITDNTTFTLTFNQKGSNLTSSETRIVLNGNADILINTEQNNFNIIGRYNLTSGNCYFNFGNVVRKKFKILENSYIVSDGDVKYSDAHIKTRYETDINISNYVYSAIPNNIYKVYLDLDIKGNISSPTFDLSIKVPYASMEVQNELHQKLEETDQTELQFLSVLTLGYFVTDISDEISSVDTDYLLGAFISSRASNFINNMVNDVNININYTKKTSSYTSVDNTSSQTTRGELELGFQKNISNKFSILGKVGIPIANSQADSENKLSSDVQIEANLSKDNKWKAKIFNRTQPNVLQSGEQTFTQGISVSYRTDFYNFWESIGNIFKTNKNTEENENTEENKDE